MKIKYFLIVLSLSFVWILPSAHAVHPTLIKAIGQAYNAQFESAEKTIAAYRAAHPSDPAAYMVLGTAMDWKQKVYDMQGKLDRAVISHYKRANRLAFLAWDKDQDNVEKMVNLGNSYMYLSKKWLDIGKKTRAGLTLKKCKKHMLKAIAKDPARWDAYLAIGLFNFYAANIPSGLKFIAALLGISGDEAKGLSQLNKAASHPNLVQADALFILSYVYGKTKKNHAKASQMMGKLAQKYPGNPFFLFKQSLYAARANRHTQTVALVQSYLDQCQAIPKKCPADYRFQAHYLKASSLVKQKNYNPALDSIKLAFQLDQNRHKGTTAELYYLEGLAYKNQGKSKKAKKSFQKAIERSSDNPSAAKRARKQL